MSNITEEKAKEQIFEMVRKYYTDFKKPNGNFKEGDRIPYAGRVFDSEEMAGLVDSALDFWLTSGKYTDIFETEFADYLNIKHCFLVNSGSSANLLAFMALTSPLLNERSIKRGDEVITVAAGFPTTVAPIVQFGAVPVFVDVTIPQYNIDVEQLKNALSSKTKAVMIAHTLGNPFNIKAVKSFCSENNLWLIEDNCDALGSEYILDGTEKLTGTFGDIGTSSFYPPHHMTMGEGGAVYTDNDLLAKIIRSMRDWGRDCVCPSGVDNLCRHRFDFKYGDLPIGYDHKYVYSHFGYNLKATDMQAAIGAAQLKKLPSFIEARRENFNKIFNMLKAADLSGVILPQTCENSNPSWFGFPLTVNENSKFSRNEIVSYLEQNKIQTRMLFAGNLLKQPCFQRMEMNKDFRIARQLTNTDLIMDNTFWVGVYPGLSDSMIDFMVRKIIEKVR